MFGNKVKVGEEFDLTKNGPQTSKLRKGLLRLVVGQEEAIEIVVKSFQAYHTGMSAPGRPISNLLFLGPTGTGKTHLVEALAKALVDNRGAVIKIDCAEFQHSHEIAKLIGSPPGYLGHRETHPLLSQEVLNQYHTQEVHLSFVLFDEIEKASDALWNLLLGILDKAILTLGDNRKVDFSRAMIFMTSNLGAQGMSNLLNPGMGYATAIFNPSTIADNKLASKINKTGIAAARRKFTPEFLNRLDGIVVFNVLGKTELKKILDLELDMLQQRALNSLLGTPFLFELTDNAKEFLLQDGTDIKYGARHLKRSIERHIGSALANLIDTNQITTGDVISVDYDTSNKRMRFILAEKGAFKHDKPLAKNAGFS